MERLLPYRRVTARLSALLAAAVEIVYFASGPRHAASTDACRFAIGLVLLSDPARRRSVEYHL